MDRGTLAMRLFSSLYKKMIQWSQHQHAPRYLGAVSFLESSFFPIPTDVMLAPMVLAKPDQAWVYAGITTITAILGAAFGYVIGMYFFDWISPALAYFGYMPAY